MKSEERYLQCMFFDVQKGKQSCKIGKDNLDHLRITAKSDCFAVKQGELFVVLLANANYRVFCAIVSMK